MKQEENHTIGELIWNIREKILGEIIPSLRAIACEWKENCIVLYFYHDGSLNSSIKDHYYSIGGEVIADYAHAVIEEHIINIPYPIPLPKHKYWAYMRKEPFVNPA